LAVLSQITTPSRGAMHSLALILACALLAAPIGAVTLAAPPETPETEQAVSVEIVHDEPSVSPGGSLRLNVDVDVTVPTEYLEARISVLRPSGALIYQKTEIAHEVEPGVYEFRFERDLTDLELEEGRHPVELRVLATGSGPTEVNDRLLVIEEDREPLPVSIVARLACSPSTDPSGRFVADPAVFTGSKDAASSLAELALAHPGLALSTAIAPLTLDEWLRISEGYETAGPAGVETVPDDDPAAVAYSDALETVRDAAEAGVLEFLDVPFADPDMAGLQSIDGVGDLTEHYSRGSSLYQAALGTTPSAGTAIRGDSVPAEGLVPLEEHGIEFMLVSPGSARSGNASASPGARRVKETTMTALVIDASISTSVSAGADASELLDGLFDRLLDGQGPPDPVVALVEVGEGTDADINDVETLLVELEGVPWIEFVTASESSERPSGSVTLPEQADPGQEAPPGYWADVGAARTAAGSFRTAVGENDPEADAAVRDVLIAESRCWAGPDESWGLAERGLDFAAEAERASTEVLGAISVAAKDVTLAGSGGKIPLTLVNGSDKTVEVAVFTESDSADVLGDQPLIVSLRPADNFVELPVALGGGLGDTLTVRVVAGDVEVAATEVRVRASYLDRLVVVASVVLVLGGMLFYIRRRVLKGRTGGDDSPPRRAD
jgi:hypothetical protein